MIAATMSKRTCPQCGKSLPSKAHHNRLYCDEACQQEARNAKRRTGRPKAATNPVKLEFAEACKLRLPGILTWFDAKMSDPETSDDTRLKVIAMLLDRGLGRPRQEVDATVTAGGSGKVVWIGDGD